MTARVRRERLEVLRPGSAVTPHAVPVSALSATDEIPYVEPREYGLRVNWQSEAVHLEAAERLVATRVKESSRRRLARAMARMREQVRAQARG